MPCLKCNIDISSNDKHLKCSECLNKFHLQCIDDITEQDYEYLTSSNANWKCNSCKNAKKHDDRPLTPIREKNIDFPPLESPSVCKTCNKGFSYNAHRATCKKCRAVFHFKCLEMTKEQFISKYGRSLEWVCADCFMKSDPGQHVAGGGDKGAAASQTIKSSDKAGPTMDVTITAILQEMRSFRAEVANTHRDLAENMTKHSDWVEELSKKLDGVSKQVTDFTSELSLIKQENTNLRKQVEDLNSKMNNLEQEARENILEIQGVPHDNNEKVIDIITKISRAIGFDFQEDMIDKCYRIKATQNPTKPGGIVVKFVRKRDLENFVQKRKVKRNLNSRDIGFMGGEASVIYVNYSLTQERRKLLKAARAARLEKHYTYLWVSNGRILMRKSQDDRVIVINNQADVDKLQ
jgi:archaellum component FlaC